MLENELIASASEGNLLILEGFLQKEEIDVNHKNQEGRSALDNACRFGHYDAVKLLLEDERTDINQGNSQKATPLYIACQEGHVEIVKLLLSDSRTDVNLEAEDGATPFFVVCENNKEDIIKEFLKHEKMDVNKPRADQVSPFFMASNNGHINALKWILASEKEVDTQAKWFERTPLDQAIELKFADIITLLNDFAKNPQLTKFKLQRELHILDEKAAQVFGLQVLLSDDYLILNSASKDDQRIRFFSISSKLPQELQMVISNRVFNLSSVILKSKFILPSITNNLASF